eukprot:1622475-Rhodomonas_salina.1
MNASVRANGGREELSMRERKEEFQGGRSRRKRKVGAAIGRRRSKEGKRGVMPEHRKAGRRKQGEGG